MEHKKCPNCEEIRPIKDYYSDSSRKSGKSAYCKICSAEMRQQRNLKSGHYDSRKHKARRAVSLAISRGKLNKLPCERCGVTKVEAHHYRGYNRENWLSVKFFCKAHHKEIHQLSAPNNHEPLI